MEAEKLLAIAERTSGRLVTVEDNYTGGLDAELAMEIARSGSKVRLENLCVRRVPKSGRTPEDVLDYLGIDWRAIAAAVKR
jgi:transketolase